MDNNEYKRDVLYIKYIPRFKHFCPGIFPHKYDWINKIFFKEEKDNI